jgi:hypothetical protein
VRGLARRRPARAVFFGAYQMRGSRFDMCIVHNRGSVLQMSSGPKGEGALMTSAELPPRPLRSPYLIAGR